MLDISMPEIMLERSRIVAVIGELVAACMAQHVGVYPEWHSSSLPEPLHEPMEADGAHGPTALGNEHVGV
jgi:hypothetical protein